MRRRGETNNQQPRIRIAEAGYRFSPVVLMCEAPDFLTGNLLAPVYEAGTEAAGDNSGVQGGEVVQSRQSIQSIQFYSVRSVRSIYSVYPVHSEESPESKVCSPDI
jgi:hypothetical protein